MGDERVEVRFDVVETAPGFIDGAEIVRMGVRERRQLPPLDAEPLVILGAPGLRAGESSPVAEDKFAERLPRAEHIPPNRFPRADEISRGLFGVGGNMDGRQRPRAMQDGQLGGIPPVGLDPVAGAAGDESGGNDLTRIPRAVRYR